MPELLSAALYVKPVMLPKDVVKVVAPPAAGAETDRVNVPETAAKFRALIYKTVPAATGVVAVQLSAIVPGFAVHVQLALRVVKAALV